MTIIFYNNSAEPNRVDKNDYIEEVVRLNGTLREESSIISPSIEVELSNSTTPTFNYAFIVEFNRYYFISDISFVYNNIWRVEFSVDVLMSYKDNILELEGFVDRNEFIYNPYIIDQKRIIKQGVDVETLEIDNDVFIKRGITIGDYVIEGFNFGIQEIE